ncbi:MAG: DUF4172 domain-containing protein [Bdellovibrionota bacterium]
MKWNWQHKDWPNFRWDSPGLPELEAQFIQQAGILTGMSKHLHAEDLDTYVVEAMTSEALTTSEIEGNASIEIVSGPPSYKKWG